LLRPVLAALLALALAAHTVRALRLLHVERVLYAVEVRSAAVAAGRAPGALLIANLRALDDAERRRPHDTRVHAARGAVLLLLGRPASAIPVYERLLAIQDRPEAHLNLGRALMLVGRREEARLHFQQAMLLDPEHMGPELPPSMR
jgi:tetratricopeptide (TPR) repeat protein